MEKNDIRKVNIIPSKSFGHRAYICDFLAGDKGGDVICRLESDDINATRKCLEGLRDGKNVISVGESGSTLRFILPLSGVLGKSVTIETKGRLSERPMKPFEDELISHGMNIEHRENGSIEVSGQLIPGTYRLPGTISSQFITGLLLSLPYLSEDSRIELTSDLKSSAYVDITLEVLKDYGIKIEKHGGVYEIPGGQTYSHDGEYVVEGDWSQAAFWLVMGLVGKHPVSVSGLRSDSVQGDRAIVGVLRTMGGDIEEADGVYTSYPSKLHGEEISVSEIPDLAPAIAAAAAFAGGTTVLTGAERLRLKESDRIESIVGALRSTGVDAEAEENSIVIRGSGKVDGGTVETMNDHRIVMMAAVLSTASERPVEILGSGAVRKSYPTFFGEMEDAGLAGDLILR